MATPDLVGMVVQNMGASLRFYRLLGLDISPEADSETHVEITTPSGFRIAWDTEELIKSIHTDWTTPSGHRMVLAFLCENPTEVNELYAKITTAGYQGYKEPWNAFWGQRYAVVVDPDGNLVDLFARLE